MKRHKRITLAVCFLAAVALLAGCGRKKEAVKEKSVRTVPVAVAPVTEMTFEDILTLAGSVQAKEYAVVSARVPGTLDAIFVDEGDRVEAGKTRLFQTDMLKLEKAVTIERDGVTVARAAVAERAANLERAQADFDKAELDYERYKRLYHEAHAVTKNAFEVQESLFLQTRAMLKHAEAQVALADAELKQAESALSMAEKDLQDSLVVAPFSGRVTARFMEPGEMANAGTPVLRIEAPRPLEISCYAPAERYRAVAVGKTRMRARVNGVDIENPVSYVSPTIHSKLRTFEVRCDIADPPDGVVSGALARIEILLDSHLGLGVPEDAVQMRGDKAVLFVVKDNKAAMVPVETGLRTKGRLEVSGPGVAAGVAAVGMGQSMVNDGDAVSVQEAK